MAADRKDSYVYNNLMYCTDVRVREYWIHHTWVACHPGKVHTYVTHSPPCFFGVLTINLVIVSGNY